MPITIVVASIIMLLMHAFVCIKYAGAPTIKASNKTMTVAQFLVFFIFFTVFSITMIGKPSKIKCYIRPMIFGYTFNIISSILLAKSTKAEEGLQRKKFEIQRW